MGAVIGAFVFLMGVVALVWKIDDHFVTRREFNEAVKGITEDLDAIRSRMGIPKLRDPGVKDTG